MTVQNESEKKKKAAGPSKFKWYQKARSSVLMEVRFGHDVTRGRSLEMVPSATSFHVVGVFCSENKRQGKPLYLGIGFLEILLIF